MMTTDYESLVQKIAQLAELKIKPEEIPALAQAMDESLNVIDQLRQVDVTGVEPTTRVSRGINRWREDKVDPARMLTQAQALQNAKQTYQGYFVVERLIDHEA